MTPPNWWQRNWKWVVPTGAVGCVTLVAGFIGLIVVFVFGLIKRSDAYVDALAEARSSPLVLQELGEPVEAGWWVSGSISTTGPSGTADFVVPVHGPEGGGRLYVTAEKRAGRWRYEVLEVAIDDGDRRIDLLGAPED